MNITRYGVSINTNKEIGIKVLRNDFAVANAEAFIKLYEKDKYDLDVLNILVNEVVRGRIKVYDDAALDLFDRQVYGLVKMGMSLKDIVVLRSFNFSMLELLSFARQNKHYEQIVRENDLEDMDVETVYGITVDCIKTEYVPYDKIMG